MDAGAVRRGKDDGAEPVVRVVEEAPQPPGGREGRGIDANAEEREELVVVERRGAGALDAREDGVGR